jgi:hypothetical protein
MLPTSVRQRTQRCFDGLLHIDEGAVIATKQTAPDVVEPDGLAHAVDFSQWTCFHDGPAVRAPRS